MKQRIKNILRNLPYYLWKKKYGRVSEPCMLWRRPLEHVEKLSARTQRKYTQVQVAPHEPPFLVLREQNGFHLVQKFDDTFGWLRSACIEPVAVSEAKALRGGRIVSLKGQQVSVSCPDSDKMNNFLHVFKDTPYLWGGVTKDGIDCSGFVQRLYLDTMHIVLPKHSRDQASQGVEVQGELANFDILHVEHQEKKQSHVAFFYDGHVHHACLSHKGVISESLDEFNTKYEIIAQRRIITCV